MLSVPAVYVSFQTRETETRQQIHLQRRHGNRATTQPDTGLWTTSRGATTDRWRCTDGPLQGLRTFPQQARVGNLHSGTDVVCLLVFPRFCSVRSKHYFLHTISSLSAQRVKEGNPIGVGHLTQATHENTACTKSGSADECNRGAQQHQSM